MAWDAREDARAALVSLDAGWNVRYSEVAQFTRGGRMIGIVRAAHEAGRRAGLAEAQKYALDAAIEAGWQDALAEASDKCATFVRERMSTAARIAEEPPELRGDREVWVRLKASEAQRCVDAIRKLAVRP